MLCIALVLVAGGSRVWGQQAPPPDAPSALRQAAATAGDPPSAAVSSSKPDFGAGDPVVVRPAEPSPSSQKFHWAPALRQSLLFMGVEHGFRMTQLYTRKRLAGPFFQGWFDSVNGVSGWGDQDAFSTNYIGHPMQGAAAGYIQIQNDPKGMKQEFGRSPEYWKSRMKATAWSAAYSVQFELGPFSEATIGNVGQKKGTGGAVDLVVTPVVGLGWMVTEDALDKYVIRRLEQRSRNRKWKALARSVLNPTRSFANMMRRKPPWHRDTRGGVAVGEAAPPPAPQIAPPTDAAKSSCSQPCP
ncbi:MAG: DUF3943 domain-containing protein [Acidobacteriota bacterium]|nr:DUF3943 domain-containing protein [Acidobacteriota bacterium]